MEFTEEELRLLIDVLFDAVINPDYSREKSEHLSNIRDRLKQVRDYGHELHPVEDLMGQYMGKNK
jgi:hypothetical protein